MPAPPSLPAKVTLFARLSVSVEALAFPPTIALVKPVPEIAKPVKV